MNARNSTTAIVVAALAAFAIPAHAGIWFKGDATTRQGNWDDLNCWWTWYYYTEHATSVGGADDVNIQYGHTVVVSGTTAGKWSLKTFSNDAAHPATVRIVSGGTFQVTAGGEEQLGTRHGDFSANFKYGCLDIQAGGTNKCNALIVGGTGHGTVTNAGCLYFLGGGMKIGRDAGSVGVYVHNGGSMEMTTPVDVAIGLDGYGELLAKSGKIHLWWEGNVANPHGNAFIGCGSGSGTGLVQVESGATFEAGQTYLGGNETTAGEGRIRLHGGRFAVQSRFGYQRNADSMWIGAATNSFGALRPDTYGLISGWGTADSTFTHEESVYARIGNGAIIADGEGVERTLDCAAMWQVTNVLFCAESTRTNGWFAVNKGAVIMPGVDIVRDNGNDRTTFTEGRNSVGCCRALSKPDLINAVAVNVGVPRSGDYKNVGAMFLAGDRSDAHADALGDKFSPLGFWKIGMFKNRTVFTAANRLGINHATVDFRYDQSKVSDAGGKLAVLRWDESGGKWTRIARYDRQPDDFIVSTGDFNEESGDPVWSIGLFCVAEEFESPFVMTVR